METPTANGRLRFGPFEIHLRTGELWRDGELVRLQNQPFRVLAALVSRPGELVTREELRREIWPEGTFVDFESSLNFCIRHIRAALGDQASRPRYIETLPRRGYRFVAAVEPVMVEVVAAEPAPVPPAPPDTAPTTAPPPRPGSRRLVVLGLGLLAVAGLAAAAAMWTRAEGPPRDVRFHRVTFRRGFVDAARFTPGGLLLYSAGWEGTPRRLHLLNPATREDEVLPIDPGEMLATTSTGEVLYRAGSTLYRVSLRGGAPREVARRVLTADVTADGNEVALARGVDGRVQVEFPLGTVLGTARAPGRLRISPDGRHLAFFEHPLPTDDRGDVVVMDRAGRTTVLARGWSSATGLAWSPDSREVWFTAAAVGIDSALHAVDLEGRRRELAPAVGRLVIHDVAPDGRVLVERNTERIETRAGRVGGGERDLSWMDATLVTDMSADGRHVLIMESGEGAGADYAAYLRPVDGSSAVRLGPGRALALSPDGRWAAASPPRQPEVIQLLPLGAGPSRSLRHADGVVVEFATFLPDGRLLYTTRAADGRRTTLVRDVEGGEPREVAGAGVVVGSAVTPDGRAVVMATPDGPRLLSLDGSPPRPLPPLGRARPLAWVGDDLVALEPGNLPAMLTRLSPDGRRTPFLALAPEDRTGVVTIGSVVLSDDGRSYAYSFLRRSSDLHVLTGLD